MVAKARVQCGGTIDVEMVLPNELAALMERVESGFIPEIEVVKADGETICLSLPFQPGTGFFPGWLVSEYNDDLQDIVYYCLANYDETLEIVDEWLCFGVPIRVPRFAILQRDQAARLVADLIEGKDTPLFVRKSI